MPKSLHFDGTLGTVGLWAVLAGAVIFVGENFIPGLKSYGQMVKYLVIGGAAVMVVAWLMK